jgi:hypothetical protein
VAGGLVGDLGAFAFLPILLRPVARQLYPVTPPMAEVRQIGAPCLEVWRKPYNRLNQIVVIDLL